MSTLVVKVIEVCKKYVEVSMYRNFGNESLMGFFLI
jgi:hypothetical protein